jgi:urate oxidase
VTTEQVKKIAKDFIDSQKRILEEFGDSAVASKLKEETISAEKTFHNLCFKRKASDRKLAARVG